MLNDEVQRAQGKNTSIRLKTGTSTQLVQSIALYMPPQVSVSYEAKYADQEIGVLAEAGADAIRGFFGSGDFSASQS